jgi:hypothetical protein
MPKRKQMAESVFMSKCFYFIHALQSGSTLNKVDSVASRLVEAGNVAHRNMFAPEAAGAIRARSDLLPDMTGQWRNGTFQPSAWS